MINAYALAECHRLLNLVGLPDWRVIDTSTPGNKYSNPHRAFNILDADGNRQARFIATSSGSDCDTGWTEMQYSQHPADEKVYTLHVSCATEPNAPTPAAAIARWLRARAAPEPGAPTT